MSSDNLQVICPWTVASWLKHCLHNRGTSGVVCTRRDQVSLLVGVFRNNVIGLVDRLEGS